MHHLQVNGYSLLLVFDSHRFEKLVDIYRYAHTHFKGKSAIAKPTYYTLTPNFAIWLIAIWFLPGCN
jgi:hypothetical protein